MKKFLSTALIGTALVAGSMSAYASSLTDNAPGVLAMISNYNSGNPVCVAAKGQAIQAKRNGLSINLDNLKELAVLNAQGNKTRSLGVGKIRGDGKRNFSLRGASGVSISPESGRAPLVAMYYRNNQPNQPARLCIVQNKRNTPDFPGFKKKQAVLQQIKSNNNSASIIDVIVKQTKGGNSGRGGRG